MGNRLSNQQCFLSLSRLVSPPPLIEISARRLTGTFADPPRPWLRPELHTPRPKPTSDGRRGAPMVVSLACVRTCRRPQKAGFEASLAVSFYNFSMPPRPCFLLLPGIRLCSFPPSVAFFFIQFAVYIAAVFSLGHQRVLRGSG